MRTLAERLRKVGEDYDFHDNALIYEAANALETKRLPKIKLLMVTTAYEQGVGKGIQRVNSNPYAVDTDEHEAWDIGYREGLDKPAANAVSEPIPDASGHVGFQEWWDSVCDQYEVGDFKKMRSAWNAANAVNTEQFVGCAYYKSNGACCESGEPCKADVHNDTVVQPQATEPEITPTTGMNIAQRILHVGGRNNEAGYIEFGSIQAVEALVRQVLRDMPITNSQATEPQAQG